MDRRNFSRLALMGLAACALPDPAQAASQEMGIFTALRARRSVRAYTQEPVSEADIKTMLDCAMLAPSAANEQPWEFIVITDRVILDKCSELSPYSSFARHAPLAILLCLNEAREQVKGMGIIDMGTCAENLMLAATGLGLGSVFTGIYPMQDRMSGYTRLFQLPGTIQPIGLIVIGHPKIGGKHEPVDRYNPKAVHLNKW